MTEVLFHSDLRLPVDFVTPTQVVEVNYGGHARREAFSDRYGIINLPDSIDLSKFRVIEVGKIGERVSKILFRGTLDSERDLCIVLIPNSSGPWKCKTVWVNLKSDTHRTLDRSRYVF